MLEVVSAYVDEVPESPLAGYVPRLEQLAAQESGAVDGLEGLVEAWGVAAEDPLFRRPQDAVVDELYYLPALANAQEAGLCLPLGIAVIYDRIIQHGEGDDPDGLDALIERTREREGGTVAEGIEEGRGADRDRQCGSHRHDRVKHGVPLTKITRESRIASRALQARTCAIA